MDYTNAQLVQAAKAQRFFLLSFCVCILCQILVIAGLSFAGLLQIIPAIAMIVFLVKALQAMNYNVINIVLLCILTILPIIGIVVLLVLNGKVTNVLKAAGLPVGFFGVSSADLEKWQQQQQQ